MTLEHIAGELNERHPATCRYMHGTDDLDMTLGDTLRPYSPPRIGSTGIFHAFLRKDSINKGDYGRRETLTLKNLSTEVPTRFMKRPRVIGFRSEVSSRVGIWRFQCS
jgi:hypothetical protein